MGLLAASLSVEAPPTCTTPSQILAELKNLGLTDTALQGLALRVVGNRKTADLEIQGTHGLRVLHRVACADAALAAAVLVAARFRPSPPQVEVDAAGPLRPRPLRTSGVRIQERTARRWGVHAGALFGWVLAPQPTQGARLGAEFSFGLTQFLAGVELWPQHELTTVRDGPRLDGRLLAGTLDGCRARWLLDRVRGSLCAGAKWGAIQAVATEAGRSQANQHMFWALTTSGRLAVFVRRGVHLDAGLSLSMRPHAHEILVPNRLRHPIPRWALQPRIGLGFESEVFL